MHEGRKEPPAAVNRSGSVIREAAYTGLAVHRQSPPPQRESPPPPPPPPPGHVGRCPSGGLPAATGDDAPPMAPPDMVAPDPVPSISPTDARAAARAERRARRATRASSEGDEQMEI